MIENLLFYFVLTVISMTSKDNFINTTVLSLQYYYNYLTKDGITQRVSKIRDDGSTRKV